MDIIVCAKQVLDISEMKIDSSTNKPVLSGLDKKVNEIDKNAVEEAIKIKDKVGGKITILTVGEADAKERISRAEIGIFQAIAENAKMAKEQRENKIKKSPRVLSDHKKKVLEIIATQRNKGKTFDQIAEYLKQEDVPTLSGRGKWHAQTVHRVYEDNLK